MRVPPLPHDVGSPGESVSGVPVSLPEGLTEVSPGPALAGLLDEMALARISGHDVVEALTASYRQACHYRAVFLLTLLETGLRQPGSADRVSRVASPGEFAGEEARAALVWSRRRADTAFNLAYGVFHRLPEIGAAMLAGEVDEPRAAAMVTWTAALSAEHAAAVCAQVLPDAAGMTVGALIDELKRLAVALDPDWAERTYRAAVEQRDVVGVRNPSGTVDVTGQNLPVDRAAAGCDRITALARRCKRAGDRRQIGQIRADLFLGMLDGTFTELTDDEIIEHVRAHREHAAECDEDPGGDGPDGEDPSDEDPSGQDPRSEDPRGEDPDGEDPDEGDHGGDGPDGDGPDEGDPGGDGHDCDGSSARPGGGARRGSGRWSVRELRSQLATLVGVDEQPAELPGWGYIPPAMARELAVTMAGAEWRYVVCDGEGHPVDVGLVRRRPLADKDGGSAQGGEVEIAVPIQVLDRLAAEVAAGEHQRWAPVITEIACACTRPDADTTHETSPDSGVDRDVGRSEGAGLSSESRFARGRLRRWILTRDRMCTHPSCRAPASGVDVDHSVDHADGGRTVDVNLGGRCRHDHSVKHKGGWQIIQVSPLVTVWISPLGHRYENRPPPVIPPPVRTLLQPTSAPVIVISSWPVRARCDGQCDPDGTCPDCRSILPPPRHLSSPPDSPAEANTVADGATDDTEEPDWLPDAARPSTSPWFTRYRQAVDNHHQRRIRRNTRLPAHWAVGFPSRLHYPTTFELDLEDHLRTSVPMSFAHGSRQ